MMKRGSVKKLYLLRGLVTEEINCVRQWASMPDPFDHRDAPQRLAMLEEILADIDNVIEEVKDANLARSNGVSA